VILLKRRDGLVVKSTELWSGRMMCPGIQKKAYEDEDEDKE